MKAKKLRRIVADTVAEALHTPSFLMAEVYIGPQDGEHTASVLTFPVTADRRRISLPELGYEVRRKETSL